MTRLIALEANSTATASTCTPCIGCSSAARAGPAQPACCTLKAEHALGQECHATFEWQTKTEVLTVLHTVPHVRTYTLVLPMIAEELHDENCVL